MHVDDGPSSVDLDDFISGLLTDPVCEPVASELGGAHYIFLHGQTAITARLMSLIEQYCSPSTALKPSDYGTQKTASTCLRFDTK